MKYISLFHISLILFFFSASGYGFAANSILPPEYDGSMMPYDFSSCDSLPSVPDSLEVVYIGYVARHGARYLSSPKKVSGIEKELYKAALDKKLTPQGEAFFSLLKSIKSRTGDNWGLLSSTGIKEEVKLGQTMARMFPHLFKNGVNTSISTFVPRVIMTMYQFNHALERSHENLQLYTASGHQYDSLLFFFDFFPEYKEFRDSGNWTAVYNEFLRKHVSPEPARRLFGKFEDNNSFRLRKLTMEMYGVLQGCRAAGLEPPTDIWMSAGDYRRCWLASNLIHYLRNTPNFYNTHCLQAVTPLIRRIITDADKALYSPDNNVSFNGYFGHAETLLPLLAALKVPGCFINNEPGEINPENGETDKIAEEWQVQDITPLGANFALIFMRSKDSRDNINSTVYVTGRLNGRNTPLISGAEYIIPWHRLKTYWESIISNN